MRKTSTPRRPASQKQAHFRVGSDNGWKVNNETVSHSPQVCAVCGSLLAQAHARMRLTPMSALSREDRRIIRLQARRRMRHEDIAQAFLVSHATVTAIVHRTATGVHAPQSTESQR